MKNITVASNIKSEVHFWNRFLEYASQTALVLKKLDLAKRIYVSFEKMFLSKTVLLWGMKNKSNWALNFEKKVQK